MGFFETSKAFLSRLMFWYKIIPLLSAPQYPLRGTRAADFSSFFPFRELFVRDFAREWGFMDCMFIDFIRASVGFEGFVW